MSSRGLVWIALAMGAWIALAGAWLAPAGTALAQGVCRITTVPLAFGTYLPGNTAAHDVTGEVEVSCRGRQASFQIAISPGTSGSFTTRLMVSASHQLLYNLYRDPAHTLIWGDGTGGTALNSGDMSRNGREDFVLPIYGRIPPQQSVGAGLYSDEVIITVYF